MCMLLHALRVPGLLRTLFVNEVPASSAEVLPTLFLGLMLVQAKSTISLHLSGRPKGSCRGVRAVVTYAAPVSGPNTRWVLAAAC